MEKFSHLVWAPPPFTGIPGAQCELGGTVDGEPDGSQSQRLPRRLSLAGAAFAEGSTSRRRKLRETGEGGKCGPLPTPAAEMATNQK